MVKEAEISMIRRDQTCQGIPQGLITNLKSNCPHNNSSLYLINASTTVIHFIVITVL